MAKQLSQVIQNQIADQKILVKFRFTINDIDHTQYVTDWSIDTNKNFGAQSATFSLVNRDGMFSEGGTNPIVVGDVVAFIEQYEGDTTEFKRFYGLVNQRGVSNLADQRKITLTCLDYISVLQFWDIDLKVEGDKIEIKNETLSPNFLTSPNDTYSSIFDFKNNGIADDPKPLLVIKDKNHDTEDPQFDGFEVYYDVGQVKLGSPLQAKDNYDLVATSYYFYVKGVYAEDVLQALLTTPDGYGNYLFNEPNAQAVIDNHLIETFLNMEGVTTDYLVPNYVPSDITIETRVTIDFDPEASGADPTVLYVADTTGFPTSGEGTVNGDTFTWTGKTLNSLTGIPASGEYSLLAHKATSYVKYMNTYDAGTIWSLKYSNVQDDLTAGDFTFPGGTFNYFDKRFGRVILTAPIDTSLVCSCNVDYSFNTLQATGIELNRMVFRSREVENRFEAVNKLRKYLAPNYTIRTIGDNKIWSSYLSQMVNEDYTLNLIQNIEYMEDEDLYTRVIFYGKNKAPTNLMFKDGVGYETTADPYTGSSVQAQLIYEKTVDGWHYFKSPLTGQGYITTENMAPKVYINGILVDNQVHILSAQPIRYTVTTRTETTTQTTGGKNPTTTTVVHTYYYYRVYFNRQGLEPTQPIYLYRSDGSLGYTIGANDPSMDYARGIWNVPGTSANSVIEDTATASFSIYYATNAVEFDYDNIYFKIRNSILPEPERAVISATYDYWTRFTPDQATGSIMDGRWDTQCQTEFYSEPPQGYNYAILDLGDVRKIQAIDLVAGFFIPDHSADEPSRKFDVNMRFSIHYSLDNINYYEIGEKTHNIQLESGASVSFEEEDLGIDFEARYLKILLEKVAKIDFKTGVWVVSFTEMSAYDDIILKAEAKLIPTTGLTQDISLSGLSSGAFPDTVYVRSTQGFEDVESAGDVKWAYIEGGGGSWDSFTYTGLTPTSFTGVEGISEDHLIDDRVVQQLEDDTHAYDNFLLLPKLGDRIFKENRVSDEVLYDRTRFNKLAKAWLQEFVKNHSKIKVSVMYSPFLQIGQTIRVIDAYNNNDNNYFIESITDRTSYYDLVLARYPE